MTKKRFRRWLLNGLAAMSLLLLVIALILWPLSYTSHWARSVEWDGPRGPNGGILNGVQYGLGVGSADGVFVVSRRFVSDDWEIPYWKLVVLLSVLPARFYWNRPSVRSRRMSRGLCPVCGYDLRATPDRCPEYGTIPPISPVPVVPVKK